MSRRPCACTPLTQRRPSAKNPSGSVAWVWRARTPKSAHYKRHFTQLISLGRFTQLISLGHFNEAYLASRSFFVLLGQFISLGSLARLGVYHFQMAEFISLGVYLALSPRYVVVGFVTRCWRSNDPPDCHLLAKPAQLVEQPTKPNSCFVITPPPGGF